MALKLSNAAANAEANALAALLNGGFLKIYDGAKPADANTAITTQNLLSTLSFANPAFAASVAGVITANAIASDANAAATGTASWFRCYESDGVTVVMDGSVGTSAADLILNSVAIQIHAQVSVSSFVHTVTE
jgi:hypothetical protein